MLASSHSYHPAAAIVLGDMDSAAMRPSHQGNPDGVNYHTLSPVAEGVRDYFAQDIVRAIYIRGDPPPIRRAKGPALDAPPTEERCRLGRIIDRQRITVEEAGLIGV